MAARPDLAHTDRAPASVHTGCVDGARNQPGSVPCPIATLSPMSSPATPMAAIRWPSCSTRKAWIPRRCSASRASSISPRPASCCRRAIRRTRPRCGSSRPIGKCLSPDIPMSARRWCWRASWRHRDVPCRTRSCSKRRPDWCGSRCGAKGRTWTAPSCRRRSRCPGALWRPWMRWRGPCVWRPGTSRRPSTRRKSCRSA